MARSLVIRAWRRLVDSGVASKKAWAQASRTAETQRMPAISRTAETKRMAKANPRRRRSGGRLIKKRSTSRMVWVQAMSTARHEDEGGRPFVSSLSAAHHVKAGTAAVNLARKLAKRHGCRVHLQGKSRWHLGEEDRFVWVGTTRHYDHTARRR